MRVAPSLKSSLRLHRCEGIWRRPPEPGRRFSQKGRHPVGGLHLGSDTRVSGFLAVDGRKGPSTPLALGIQPAVIRP